MITDRIGLGWRAPLAAAILANLDRIDVVEVIAEEAYAAPRAARRALRTLAAQVPVVLHGVSLGLASAAPVAQRRLRDMATLVDELQPEFWSEHLAFVRGGGIEIGHLAAPPRSAATIEGAVRNLMRARAVVGSAPLLENVATLIEPPGSSCDEAEWLTAIARESSCDLLLDLHNLHANALNFGFDASETLARLPVERIAAVHLAGGRRMGGNRWLDDHLHDVPEPVYALLGELGARAERPLTVILERDGRYPAFEVLLAQLERARAVLADARQPRAHASAAAVAR